MFRKKPSKILFHENFWCNPYVNFTNPFCEIPVFLSTSQSIDRCRVVNDQYHTSRPQKDGKTQRSKFMSKRQLLAKMVKNQPVLSTAFCRLPLETKFNNFLQWEMIFFSKICILENIFLFHEEVFFEYYEWIELLVILINDMW